MKTILSLLILSTVLFSCKKEVVPNSTFTPGKSDENSIMSSNSHGGNWLGVYGSGDYPYPLDTVQDNTFISNGIATLSNTPYSYFYTSINLKIPFGHRMSGDSTKFEVRLRNPSGQTGSIFPYDVSLWLYGSQDTAHVQFLADLVQYTALAVGDKGKTNTKSLLYQFQDWTDLTLEAKDKYLTVYKEGLPVQSIRYIGANIGNLKKIEIGFKGAGSVDWVKLYNSNTNVQMMQEDFNLTGQSNVVWY